MLALAMVAGAACSEAVAKKDKKNKKTVPAAVIQKSIVSLQTKADSISYAAGKSLTMGMMDYVVGQLKVDTAYILTCQRHRERAQRGGDTADEG